MAALGVVREALESHIARSQKGSGNKRMRQDNARRARQALKETTSAMPSPSALELLCTMFALSTFERDLLLLCAGIELDSTFAAVCGEAQGDPARAFPTLSLALAALPEAHWSALTPAAPLRRWRLIEVGSGSVLTLSSLRIDERVLHYLAGVQHLDERLAGLVEPLHQTSELAPSHHALAARIAGLWSQSAAAVMPVVQLCGDDLPDKRAIAVAACATMGLHVGSISGQSVPIGATELDGFLRLWGREAVLTNCALLLECHEMDSSDAARSSAINRLIEGLNSPLIISTVARLRSSHKSILTFDVQKPSPSEQRDIWQRALKGCR